MTVKQRVLTARLIKKLQQSPDYTRQLGLSVEERKPEPPVCEMNK